AGSPSMGMVFRHYNIAKHLTEAGYKTEILTSNFSRIRRINPEIQYDLQSKESDGITYHFLQTLKYKGNGISRALSMMFFGFKAWFYANTVAKNSSPDVVICSSPSPLTIWGAHRVARKAGAKLFFEVRDIWPLSIHELSGMSTIHPFYVLCQIAEDFAYKNASKVISLLPYSLDHMQERGLAPEKFICIPNGYNDSEFKNPEALEPDLLEKILAFKKRFPFIVGYSGTHGYANSLHTLLDSTKHVPKEVGVGLIFVGSGPHREALLYKAEHDKIENVLFLPAIHKNQIPTILNHFDVAYVGLRKTPLFRFGVSPNKLVDYMACSKPVLYAISTENDPVKESQCGIHATPGDSKSIAAAILNFSKMPKSELSQMGERGKTWVESHISYDVLIKKLINLF
ncbi:MAG: glycosyltransferase family 4 protein, partial [Pseudobdellovibrio sp.]